MEQYSSLLSIKELLQVFGKSSIPLSILLGEDFKITFVNEMMLHQFEITQKIDGDLLKTLIPMDKNPILYDKLKFVLSSGKSIKEQAFQLTFSDHGVFRNMKADLEFHALRDGSGKVIGILSYAHNTVSFSLNSTASGQISSNNPPNSYLINSAAQDRAEDIRLIESEERFRLMADGTELLIAVSNERDEKIYYNKKWSELTGRDNSDLMQSGWTDLIHQDERDHFIKSRQDKKNSFKSFSREFRLQNKKGDFQWMLCHSQPRHFRNGQFAGYVTSCLDITQRKLEEIRKNEFITIVSHELKTPVTSLLGFLQVLQRKSASSKDAQTETILLRMRNQINRMTAIITDFLSLNRLERGELLLNTSRFPISMLLKELVADHGFLHAGHFFHLSISNDDIEIEADREKVYTVLSNLLTNASKYSAFGTQIQLNCRKEDNHLIIEVCDQGPGVPDSELTRIFDKFYRAPSHPTISGFGIGLYLCSEIVSLHGGRIYAENLEQGCRFVVILPCIYADI